MRLIGDCHGKFRQYKRLIADCPASIQVGDMGVGFRNLTTGDVTGNPPHYAMVPDHRFIRGNHDNPGACRNHSQWIPDGTVEGDTMFIGGGLSIDRHRRTPDYSWWADEELSTAELNNLVDQYAAVRPRTMITHDCPESVAAHILARHNWSKIDDPSRTRQAFEQMLYHHEPDLWVFGHWHHPLDTTIGNTRFVCLAELEYMDLPI